MPGTPQIKQVYSAMDPLVAYALAPMHLAAFYIPRGSGKTTWEPVSSSTSTAAPCFHAEISGGSDKTTWQPTSTSPSTATPCFGSEILGFEPPGTPQIKQVYSAMDPLVAYALAPMHLAA
ncbi:hypothetical protein THAOC_36742, partial [Thalassiosira oceanica]